MQIARQRLEHVAQRPVLDPALKAAMTRLIRRVPLGQIFHGAPVRRIQRMPFGPRSATSIASQTRLRQQRFEDGPLGVSQVHAVEYDGDRNFVHRPHLGFMR